MLNTCKTCRWWKQTEKGDLYEGEADLLIDDETDEIMVGECRRYPPQMDFVERNRLREATTEVHVFANDNRETCNRSTATRFPIVDDGCFCGEHQPVPAEPQNVTTTPGV